MRLSHVTVTVSVAVVRGAGGIGRHPQGLNKLQQQQVNTYACAACGSHGHKDGEEASQKECHQHFRDHRTRSVEDTHGCRELSCSGSDDEID